MIKKRMRERKMEEGSSVGYIMDGKEKGKRETIG